MRQSTRCIIFAAGTYYWPEDTPPLPEGALTTEDDTLLIAADGGLDHMRRAGLRPAVIIGDFDSLPGDPPDDARVVRLPAEKDDTDLLAALKVGWQRGIREFHIYGGLGGRLDHTVANLQLAARLARQGGIGYLYGDGVVACAISDAELRFDAARTCDGDVVSVLSHSDISRDVNESGLLYELSHATMSNDTVRGVSNELIGGSSATISVGEGVLTVTFPLRAAPPAWHPHSPRNGDLGALDMETSAALTRPLHA